MDRTESVAFIKALESGDTSASSELWEENFTRLAQFAERRLGKHRRAKGGEDIAAQAIHSFFNGVNKGDWKLDSRNDLWRMLLSIASNKARKHITSEQALRRGGGEVRGNSIFAKTDGSGTFDGFAGAAAGIEDSADAILEECEDLLADFSETERSIARLMLEGSKREEISQQLGYSIGHVDRCLKSIRAKLSDTLEDIKAE